MRGQRAGSGRLDQEAVVLPKAFLRLDDRGIRDKNGGRLVVFGQTIGDTADAARPQGVGCDAGYGGFGFRADVERVGERRAVFGLYCDNPG